MTLHDRRPIDAEFLKLQMDTISLCDCPECKQPGYKHRSKVQEATLLGLFLVHTASIHFMEMEINDGMGEI